MKKSDMNRSTRSSRSSTIGRVRGRGEVTKAKVNQRSKGGTSNLRGKPTKKSIATQKTKKPKPNQQTKKSPVKKTIMPSLEATIKNQDICTEIEPAIATGKAADKKFVADKLKSVTKNITTVSKSVTRRRANSDKAVLDVIEDIDIENIEKKEILTSPEENVNVNFKSTRASGRFQVKSTATISNEKSFAQIEKCKTKPVEISSVSETKTINNVITTIPKSITSLTSALKTPTTIPIVNDSVATSTSKHSITMPISSNSGIASFTANTLFSSVASMVSGQTMVTSKPLTSPPPPMIRSNNSNPISNSGPNTISGSGPQQQWVPVYVVDMPNLQKSESSILRPMVPNPSMVSNFPMSPVKPSLSLTSTMQTMGLPRMVTKPVPIAARVQKPLMKTKAIPIPNSLYTSVSSMSVPSTMPIFKPLLKNTSPTTVLTSTDNLVSSNLPVNTNYDDRLNNKQERQKLNPMRTVVKPDIGKGGGRSIVMKSQFNPYVENASVIVEKTSLSNDIASPENMIKGHAPEVKCVLCEKVFPSLKDMQEHYLKTHKGRKSREKNKKNMESSGTQTTIEVSKNTNKDFREGSEVSANGSQPHPLEIIIDDSEVDPKCPVCSCGFRTAAEVKRHIAQVHSYICSECNITFYTLFQFTSHKCTKVAKKVKKTKKLQNNNTITSNNNQSILTSEINKPDSSLLNPFTKFVAIKPKIFVAPPCDDLSEPPVLTAEPSVLVPLSGNHMSSPPPLQKISNISVVTHDNPWIVPSQSEVTPSTKSNTNSVTPQKPRKVPVIETNNIEEAKKLAKKLDMESPDEKAFKPEVVLRKLDQLKANGIVSISFIPRKKRHLDEILEGDEHLEYVCGRCNVLCFDSADYMDHIQECLIMSSVSVVPVPSKGPRRFLKLKKEVASFAFDDQNNNTYTLNRNLINKLSEVLGPTMGKPMHTPPSVSPDKSNEKLSPTNQIEMPTKQFQGLAQPPPQLALLPPKLTPMPPQSTPMPPQLNRLPPQLTRLPPQLTPSPQLYGKIPVSSMQNTTSITYSGNIPYTLVPTNGINSPTQYIHPAHGNISVASAMRNVTSASAMSHFSVASAISNVPISSAICNVSAASVFSNGSIPTAISNVPYTTANSRITIPGVPNMISKTFNPSNSNTLSNKSPKTTSIATEKSTHKKVVTKKPFSNVIVPKFIPRSQVAKTTKGSSTPSINVKPASSLMTNPTMVNTTRLSTSVASSNLVKESGKSVTKVGAKSPVGGFSTLKSAPISTLTANVPTNSIVTSISSGKVPVKTTTVSRPDPNSISSYIFTPQISKKSSVASNVSPKTTSAPSANNSMVSSEPSRPTHPSFRDLLDDDDFPLSQQPHKIRHQSSKVMEIPFHQQETHNVKASTNKSNVRKSPIKKGIKLNQPMVMIPVNQSLTKGPMSEMMNDSRGDSCSTASSTLDLLLDADDIKMEVEEEVLDDIF